MIENKSVKAIALGFISLSFSASRTSEKCPLDKEIPARILLKEDDRLSKLYRQKSSVAEKVLDVREAASLNRLKVGEASIIFSEVAQNNVAQQLAIEIKHSQREMELARSMVLEEMQKEFKDKKNQIEKRSEADVRAEYARRSLETYAGFSGITPSDARASMAKMANGMGQYRDATLKGLGLSGDEEKAGNSTGKELLVAHATAAGWSSLPEKERETAAPAFDNAAEITLASSAASKLGATFDVDALERMRQIPGTPDLSNVGKEAEKGIKKQAMGIAKKAIINTISKALIGIKVAGSVPGLTLHLILKSPDANLCADMSEEEVCREMRAQARVHMMTTKLIESMREASRENEAKDYSSPSWNRDRGRDPMQRDGGIRGYDRNDAGIERGAGTIST